MLQLSDYHNQLPPHSEMPHCSLELLIGERMFKVKTTRTMDDGVRDDLAHIRVRTASQPCEKRVNQLTPLYLFHLLHSRNQNAALIPCQKD